MAKITKREHYAQLTALVETHATDEEKEELLTFIAHEVELLDNKASKSNSKDKQKKANNEEIVYNALVAINRPVAVSDFIISAPTLRELVADGEILTSQRVTAYLTKLVNSGRVEKVMDKKKTYFSAIV